jgi:hypothetical protein
MVETIKTILKALDDHCQIVALDQGLLAMTRGQVGAAQGWDREPCRLPLKWQAGRSLHLAPVASCPSSTKPTAPEGPSLWGDTAQSSRNQT